MIFIVVKFTIRADRSDEWLTLNDEFTRATRTYQAATRSCEAIIAS